MCLHSQRHCREPEGKFCASTWTTHFVVDWIPLFSKALSKLRHRFPFRECKAGERMFVAPSYVQNDVLFFPLFFLFFRFFFFFPFFFFHSFLSFLSFLSILSSRSHRLSLPWESRKCQCLLQGRNCETILLTKLKFVRFVVLVAVSVGWLVKHVRTYPVKCHHRSKPCRNLLSLRSAIRVWWCVVFTSMLIWVSRTDEYLFKKT